MKRISWSLVMFIMAFSVSMVFTNCNTDNGTTTYTVTFDSNGGSTVAAISGISSGSTITLPSAPIRGVFAFTDRYKDNGTFLNKFTAESVVTEDITVYAKWFHYILGKWRIETDAGKYVILEFKSDSSVTGRSYLSDDEPDISQEASNVDTTYTITTSEIYITEWDTTMGYSFSDNNNKLHLEDSEYTRIVE